MLFFFFGSTFLWSQTERYFSFNLDNDLYFLSDYYYSSGIFFQWGKKTASTKDSLAQYRQWELGQEMYTPSDRYSENTAEYDYTYGGWSFLKYSHWREHRTNAQYLYGVQVGVTGDWSLARWMQNNYHKAVLGLPFNAWVDQVPEAVHVNFFTAYFHQHSLTKFTTFESQFYSRLGSQRIDAGTRLGFNIGRTSVLNRGDNPFSAKTMGDAVYLGVNASYVQHDYMLSGSLFRDDAPFTLQSNTQRLIVEAGFARRTPRWKVLVLFSSRSRDTPIQEKKNHLYLNFTISRLF